MNQPPQPNNIPPQGIFPQPGYISPPPQGAYPNYVPPQGPQGGQPLPPYQYNKIQPEPIYNPIQPPFPQENAPLLPRPSIPPRVLKIDKDIKSGGFVCYHVWLYIMYIAFIILNFVTIGNLLGWNPYYYYNSSSTYVNDNNVHDATLDVVSQYIGAFLLIISGIVLTCLVFIQVLAFNEKKALFASYGLLLSLIYAFLMLAILIFMGSTTYTGYTYYYGETFGGYMSDYMGGWIAAFIIHLIFNLPGACVLRSKLVQRREEMIQARYMI